MLNVKVYDRTIRKGLNKQGLFRRFARKQPLLSKKSMTAQLRSRHLHLNKPQKHNVLGTDEKKEEMFGRNAQVNHIWQKKTDTPYLHKHLNRTLWQIQIYLYHFGLFCSYRTCACACGVIKLTVNCNMMQQNSILTDQSEQQQIG